MSGSYFINGSILEKCGNFRKNSRFSGRIWLDWGNTTRADMAGLGSIGLRPGSTRRRNKRKTATNVKAFISNRGLPTNGNRRRCVADE